MRYELTGYEWAAIKPLLPISGRAFLHHDSAGHSGTDQHAGWHVREVDGDRNALRQSDPGECGIDGREELWTVLLSGSVMPLAMLETVPCSAGDPS